MNNPTQFTDEQLAQTQAKLSAIAFLAIELTDLDAFIERTAGVVDADDFHELALAVAAIQRVAHRQLGVGSDAG